MRNLTSGCELYWAESIYGSMGTEFGGTDMDHYAAYCKTEACLKIINAKDYIHRPEPILSTTQPAPVTIPETPVTTPQSPVTVLSTKGPCLKCPSTRDSRGFVWPKACIGETLTMTDNCPEGESGFAEWICGSDQKFHPEEPIRENCVSNWMKDAKQSKNPKNITMTILEHIFDYSNYSSQVTSGTLKEIISTVPLIEELIEKESDHSLSLSMSALADFAQISSIFISP